MKSVVLFLVLLGALVVAVSADESLEEALMSNGDSSEEEMDSDNEDLTPDDDGNDSDGMEPAGTSWSTEMKKAVRHHAHKDFKLQYHPAYADLHEKFKSALLLEKLHKLQTTQNTKQQAEEEIAKKKKWRKVQEQTMRYLLKLLQQVSHDTRHMYREMRHGWKETKEKSWAHKLFWNTGKQMRARLGEVAARAAKVEGKSGEYLRRKLDILSRRLRQEFDEAEDGDDEYMDAVKDSDSDGIVHSGGDEPEATPTPTAPVVDEDYLRWKQRMEAVKQDMEDEFERIHQNLERMIKFIQSRHELMIKKQKEAQAVTAKEQKLHEIRAQRVKNLFASVGKYIRSIYKKINAKEAERVAKLKADEEKRQKLARQKEWAAKLEAWEKLKATRKKQWEELSKKQDEVWRKAMEKRQDDEEKWMHEHLLQQRKLAEEAKKLQEYKEHYKSTQSEVEKKKKLLREKEDRIILAHMMREMNEAAHAHAHHHHKHHHDHTELPPLPIIMHDKPAPEMHIHLEKPKPTPKPHAIPIEIHLENQHHDVPSLPEWLFGGHTNAPQQHTILLGSEDETDTDSE